MPDNLAQKLATAWQQQLQQPVTIEDLRPLSAGASATSYAFTAASSDGHHQAVLQLSTGDSQFGVALNKIEQAQVQQQAYQSGITTPPVLLTLSEDDGRPEGFVSAFVDGETLGGRIVSQPQFEGARQQLSTQCAQTLARIHALSICEFPQLRTRDALTQLEELQQIHQSFGEDLPTFASAAAWMRDHLAQPGEICIVHGDFRVGNLLVDEQGLAGVLDWELAHLGDPMEDIAWLCLRSWRFGQKHKPVGGFAQRAPFYKAYEAASGRQVDHDAIRFWEVLGAYKWGVICQWFAHRRLRGELDQLEPAVIGRRVSEAEIQMLELMDEPWTGAPPDETLRPTSIHATESAFGNRPYRDELFAVIQQWLKSLAAGAEASRYEARIAGHALAILQRESALGVACAQAEIDRLQKLVANDSCSLSALNQRLCERINSGQLNYADSQLLQHLRASVQARLAIDNPKF